jgi:hypothetical protein
MLLFLVGRTRSPSLRCHTAIDCFPSGVDRRLFERTSQYRPVAQIRAISRAYRMGQTRKVFVYRLLCTDTIDERIIQILANKQRIFDAFADRSVAAEQVDQAFSRETMDQIVRDELRKYAGAR